MARKLLQLAASLALGASLALSQPAHAIKYSYNANHPDLDWKSIETPHFVVHYPVSKRTREEGNEHYINAEFAARKGAEVAELMWEPMCAEFNYFLKEKIHIVMLDQGDDLAGFTIPAWDWVQISANPGSSFARMRGRMEWFSDVLVHEFAHVVSMKAYRAHSEGAMQVGIGALYTDGVRDMATGVNFAISDGDSVFWTEGGAEYWSHTSGWNWWTASRDQGIRMSVLEDRLLTYDEWHDRAGKSWSWADGERYYQQGNSFPLYLRQRFGSDVYARFAAEFSKGWRPEFVSVIEDVVGIPAEELYWDWRNYLTERYTAQYDRVKARGEVVGRELRAGPEKWNYSTPEGRDTYMEERRFWREENRERTGDWQYEPRVHPSKGFWGVINRGTIVIHREDDDQMFALTGVGASDPLRQDESARLSDALPATFEYGWDFIANQEAIVYTAMEDEYPKTHPWRPRFEFDGYNHSEIAVFSMPVREESKKGRTFKTREEKNVVKRPKYEEGSIKTIPNTKRGNQPAASPDGSRVVFIEYFDGTHNLVSINLDGSDKKYLTDFKDGTWLQNPDWSPDGKQIVFGMFRNYQQNLWIVNADGTNLRPLTWDAWEELDPHWGTDGRIYFSAEPDGIFNIYSIDPNSKDVRQITNVIGGAATPSLTAEGNLIYSYFTSFGLKVYALNREEFLNAPAGHLFRTEAEYDDKIVAQSLAYREDLSHWATTTRDYRPLKSLGAPYAAPLFRLENDTQTDFELQGGWYLGAQDFVQDHEVFNVALFGEDLVFQGGYTWHGWYPDFSLLALYFQGKYDNGYKLDEDLDPATTDDQTIYDVKQNNRQMFVYGDMLFPFNLGIAGTLYGQYFNFAFRGTADDTFQQYMQAAEIGTRWTFSTYGATSYAGQFGANPFYGRNIDLSFAHAWTDIIYPDYGGVISDDGELLSNYQFNRIEGRWVENIRPPSLWGLLDGARKNQHTIQVDVQAGFIDRNVGLNDEFRAGGQHPYRFGYGTLRPNTQFAGYPFFALNGETMAMMNLAYRFPINREIKRQIGPLFIYGIYGQVGGTAGNLWSYSPPSDPSLYYRDRAGDRIARNADDIRREIPFVDVAHKNGNRILYDAQAELRVQSTMFHSASWDSFIRFAYAFNEIRGYGDVDGDGVFDTSQNAIGDELSNETEKPGVRVYLGLGTGW